MSVDLSLLTPAQKQALLDGPALAPPTGVTPEFDNPPNMENLAWAVYITCFTIGSLFVFMRAYSTWASSKKLYISDYLLVLSYTFYVAFMAVIFRQVQVGYFIHQWNFRLRDAIGLFHLFIIATNLFIFAIMFIKAAILLEWIRIFLPHGTRNYFYWISMGLLALDVLFYCAGCITINVQCTPYEKIWNPLVPGHCVDTKAVDITSAAINFVIDLVILVLPQKVIWGLHMPFSKRLGVSAVFAVGLLACFAAGYRLAVTIAYSKSQDTTYTFCTVGIWVVVETTCGLIVLCMPAFPKAVSELGVTKVYISLKSWATTQSRNKSSSAIDDSVARFAESHRLKAQKDPWQELDTSTTALGDELESVGTYENGIELGTNTPHKDSTILRTTQISIATKDNGQDHIHDFNRQRNSPWAPRDPRYESR